ncbi:MAG: methyltransferase domain-containing protein [Capsulimonadales bacterium]|nr:methyltransferase domain-containing protein [Capsulimonadales bacterium]
MNDVRDGYTRWAATYDTDRNRTRDLDERVTRDALSGRRFGSILELGCGTGKNTRLLAEIGDAVLALDFSEGMLAQARAKVNAPHVTFATADLTNPWPCAAASVDLIVGNLVLEHIADLAFIFAEAARTLKPGCEFLLSELHPFRQYLGTKANFAQDGERVELTAFVHHISDFTNAAADAGLSLLRLGEWWHEEDIDAPPRLITLRFRR